MLNIHVFLIQFMLIVLSFIIAFQGVPISDWKLFKK